MTVDIEFVPMRVGPFLLLRRRHANPKQIWVGSIDGINDSLVVLLREIRLVRWRVGNDLQVRIHLSRPLHNKVKHLLRAAQEHYRSLGRTECSSTFFEFVHFKLEEIPSCYSFLRQALRLYPSARLHDAHPVRNEHITVCQRLGEQPILTRRVVRMSIYCVNEQFALRQRGKLRLATKYI